MGVGVGEVVVVVGLGVGVGVEVVAEVALGLPLFFLAPPLAGLAPEGGFEAEAEAESGVGAVTPGAEMLGATGSAASPLSAASSS